MMKILAFTLLVVLTFAYAAEELQADDASEAKTIAKKPGKRGIGSLGYGYNSGLGSTLGYDSTGYSYPAPITKVAYTAGGGHGIGYSGYNGGGYTGYGGLNSYPAVSSIGGYNSGIGYPSYSTYNSGLGGYNNGYNSIYSGYKGGLGGYSGLGSGYSGLGSGYSGLGGTYSGLGNGYSSFGNGYSGLGSGIGYNGLQGGYSGASAGYPYTRVAGLPQTTGYTGYAQNGGYYY